jgi:hypothetical protein
MISNRSHSCAPLVESRYTVLPVVKDSMETTVEQRVWNKSFSILASDDVYNYKQGHYSDHMICENMTLNEIRYKSATSIFLSVVGLALKSSHTQNMLLHIAFNCTIISRWKWYTRVIQKIRGQCCSPSNYLSENSKSIHYIL